MAPTVIVFGPTGQSASVAARTAHSRGAKVVLALRDTSKPIGGLTPDEERNGNYSRVQADLTKPESVASAVKSSGATRAFIYLVFGTSDFMRASIEALRSGGIEFVVFLSSSSVGIHGDDVRKIPQDAIIPYQHGMVEASLEDVFGKEKFVALRPGYFATNHLRLKQGITNGEVKILAPELTWDSITPEDIGEVGGAILAEQTGPKDEQRIVYLYGPQNRSMNDIIAAIGKALGKDIKVTGISKDEQLEQFMAQKLPRPLAEYFVRVQSERNDDDETRPQNKEGVENVRRYIGRPATGLEEWLAENKQAFLA